MVMGRERPSDWYDAVFATSRRYRTTPQGSKWYPVWSQVLQLLEKSDPTTIVDIACGPGHLAQMIAQDKKLPSLRSYRGIDFSEVALAQARLRVGKNSRFVFEKADLVENPEVVSSGEDAFYVLCEFLEHVRDDLLVLSMVPPKARIAFTVPDCGGSPHVRWFANEEEVINRYGGLVDGLSVRRVGDHHYVAFGWRSFSMSLLAPEPSSPPPPGAAPKAEAERPRGVSRGRRGRRGRKGEQ